MLHAVAASKFSIWVGGRGRTLTDASRYVKIVEWSDADGAFVGQCPGVIGPCCHGPDETEVYRELCQIVEDWVALIQKDGRPLPPPTAGRNVARLIA